jgi:hypothetical protein
MNTQDIVSALTALFMVGMIWLRTRVQYGRQVRGSLRLQPAGRVYFVIVVLVLLLGWLVAPAAGRAVWPDPDITPMLPRGIWFLATYYLSIPASRILKTRGIEVFKGES